MADLWRKHDLSKARPLKLLEDQNAAARKLLADSVLPLGAMHDRPDQSGSTAGEQDAVVRLPGKLLKIAFIQSFDEAARLVAQRAHRLIAVSAEEPGYH